MCISKSNSFKRKLDYSEHTVIALENAQKETETQDGNSFLWSLTYPEQKARSLCSVGRREVAAGLKEDFITSTLGEGGGRPSLIRSLLWPTATSSFVPQVKLNKITVLFNNNGRN